MSSRTFADQLGVGLGAPGGGRRRGRPETGEVEGQRRQRPVPVPRDDRVEVAMGTGPPVEGEDTGRLGPGDRAEQASLGKRTEHGVQAAPLLRGRLRGRPTRSPGASCTIGRPPALPIAIDDSFLPIGARVALRATQTAGSPYRRDHCPEPHAQPFGTVSTWRSRSKVRPGRNSPEPAASHWPSDPPSRPRTRCSVSWPAQERERPGY